MGTPFLVESYFLKRISNILIRQEKHGFFQEWQMGFCFFCALKLENFVPSCLRVKRGSTMTHTKIR